MNSLNNQIQVIISEIDEVLHQSSTLDSPKTLAETLRKSKRMLKQVLNHLTQDVDKVNSLHILSAAPYPTQKNTDYLSTQEYPQPVEDFLASINQYLQADFKILQEQRQALQEEIRQLERQRQENYSLAQQYSKQQQIISEFSQALLGPIQENLLQHLSQFVSQHQSSGSSQRAVVSSENFHSQSIQSQPSEIITTLEDELDEAPNFEQSFVNSSNTENRDEKSRPDKEHEPNTQSQKLSAQTDELNEPIQKEILPYPGYEFFDTVHRESKSTETEKNLLAQKESEFQEDYFQNQETIDEEHALERLESTNQENQNYDQLEAPSFEDNDVYMNNHQNLAAQVKDETELDSIQFRLPLTPSLELEGSENLDNLESSQTIKSLSSLFGDLDINEVQTNQSITSLEAQTNQTDLTAKLETDKYIHASPTESLLPTEEPDVKQSQELLLDTNTMQKLRSDLENLEEVDLDEFMDAPQQTILQLGEEQYPATKNNPDFANNHSILAAETEVTGLEDLFANISQNDLPENFPSSNQENIYTETENAENETTLEDILDGLTSSTEAETLEADSQEIVSLETLLQDPPNSEKKKFSSLEIAEVTEAGMKQHRTASAWYLGIDFGTTGLSAALLNRSSGEVYPVYWQVVAAKNNLDIYEINREFTLSTKTVKTDLSYTEIIYRLPSIIYIDTKLQVSDDSSATTKEKIPLFIQDFKAALKITIPYVSINLRREKMQEKVEESFILASNFAAATAQEPVCQWSENKQIPLSLVRQGLVALLMTFQATTSIKKSISQEERETQTVVTLPYEYACGAVGLEQKTFVSALAQLKSVVMGCPASWPEAYRFNLREAVLEADLVKDVNQVIVIEDAIATSLSELTSITEDTEDRENFSISEFRRGGILIVNVGATTTELALIDLPARGQDLTDSDFYCHSFAYGGNALDQDIICQLLLRDEILSTSTQNQENQAASGQSWPRPGVPDLSIRYQLQQWLRSSSYREELLAAARNLKVILPYEQEFTLNIGDRQWHLKEKDLEARVLGPFVQKLNDELNIFLSRTGISPVGINRAICTGASGGWGAIARWLRQKLPNAIIVQDGVVEPENVDLEEGDNQRSDNLLSPIADIKLTIGRVAYGLAILPLYPQIIDVPQQKYNDYFLLWEMMRVFPNRSLSVREILQLLEEKGINTHVCQEKIQAILESKLPPGLVPSEEDFMLLSAASQENSDYQSLKAKPFFCQEIGGSGYRLIDEQAKSLREYLNKLVASSRQKFDEPLLKSLEVQNHL